MADILSNAVHSRLPVYILAGGRSSRMGADKGLLRFDGETMISRIINRLQSPIREVSIVSNNEVYEKFEKKVIHDLIPNAGPAGGIYTALQYTSFEKIFICSCDMPFVTGKALEYIYGQADKNAQIALPVKDGKMQPLFGVYAKNCLPEWKRMIAGGMMRLKEMVTHFDLTSVNVDSNPLFNDNVFMNVNDKKDFDNALSLICHVD